MILNASFCYLFENPIRNQLDTQSLISNFFYDNPWKNMLSEIKNNAYQILEENSKSLSPTELEKILEQAKNMKIFKDTDLSKLKLPSDLVNLKQQ